MTTNSTRAGQRPENQRGRLGPADGGPSTMHSQAARDLEALMYRAINEISACREAVAGSGHVDLVAGRLDLLERAIHAAALAVAFADVKDYQAGPRVRPAFLQVVQ